MAGGRTRRKRSAGEWGVRAALAAAVAVAGYLSVATTLAYPLRTRDPARAFMFAPHDGRMTGAYAMKLAGATATPAQRARATTLALSALRQDPTSLPALTALGINRQLAGDLPAARRIFAYAGRLSRRDLQTRIWAIEDAVARGDIDGALKSYDIALRTSRSAPDLLYPILAAATSDPAIRRPLAGILRARPVWADGFLEFLAAKGPDPRAAADLISTLARSGYPVADPVRAQLIGNLISGNAPDIAWSLYAAAHPGSSRNASRDPRFAANPSVATPFDWRPIEEAGVTTSIQRGDNGGILDFSAAPGVGGPMAQQVQLLPPGYYLLEGRSTGVEQMRESRPYWALVCRDGRELGRVDVTNSDEAAGRHAGRIRVPADCPVQTLGLYSRASDSMSGNTGQILEVRLRPAGAR